MNLLIALFLIVFEASYEGFKLRKWHIASEIIEFIFYAGIVFTIFGFTNGYITYQYSNPDFWFVLFGFVLLRFAIFDLIFNLCANQSLFYIGKTKLYDRLLSKLGAFVFILKLMAFVIGLSWLCDWRYGIL